MRPLIMFTFEHFAFPCVRWWNRLGLRPRGGELEGGPVVLVVEDEEPLQEIARDVFNEIGRRKDVDARGKPGHDVIT